MIVFPNAKINLGLHIVKKRKDGFHNLETVFYPVYIQDALEIIHADSIQNGDVQCFVSGNMPAITNEDNICVKAYSILKKDFPLLPPVVIHLHKTVPAGAGLGGGSADGAFALLLLNKKFNLGLTEEQLREYALQLGSDCPFFIKNKPSYATGRGEVLEDINVDLSAYKIIIVNPQIHINTGWAFSQLQLKPHHASLKEAILQPVNDWRNSITNDFEVPVFEQYPDIRNIKEVLYTAGAIYASLSGSGSTLFGIFLKEERPVLHFPNHYYVKEVK